MKTAIIHIGAPKTGSSSIQVALRESAHLLESNHGFHFRDYDQRVQLLSLGFQPQEKQNFLLRMPQKPLPDLQRQSFYSWVKLARVVRTQKPTFTVISNEILFRVRQTRRFKRILNNIFDRVVIVAYVRGPASRMPSGIDQRIRGGATLDDLCKGRRDGLPILDKLDRYVRTFREGNVIVRNFDKQNLRDGCVVSDFSSIISNVAQKDISLVNPGVANQSLPASVSAFLLKENQRPRSSDENSQRNWLKTRKDLIRRLRQNPALVKGKKLKLDDPILSGHIWNVCADEITEINRRFLSNQRPIEVGVSGPSLSQSELRNAFENWIFKNESRRVNETLSELAKLSSQ